MSNEPGILPEPIPFGKYYLLERISVGGMAEIYKAKAFGVEGFERLLAVKKILSSIAEDESFIEMFIDEAKIAGKLNHPNIAQIYDLGKVDGSYYIALEYISGKDCKTIFERGRRVGEPVDIPQVCYIVKKVCEGLSHAHNKTDSQGRDLNIVHRDISPQNILISFDGEVKIIDFGIAKAQGKTSQTQVGVLKGKFSYMSPEQVRGLHVDHRSDIFSLGIVMYEMLTLERLFLGESDFDTLEKIRKVEMSPPSLYNPNIPEDLEDIVLKALAQNREDRFQSAEEFAEAIERFLRDHDYYYNSTDLGEFMKDTFQEDIEFEQKKLEYYRSLDLEPPDQREESEEEDNDDADEGLMWDDEEMETQIFEGSEEEAPPPSPSNTSQPQGKDSDIVYADDVAQESGSRPSQRSEGVEVVGPDNEVDIVEPDDEPADKEPPAPTSEYGREAISQEIPEVAPDQEGAESRDDARRREPTAEVPSADPSSEGLAQPDTAPPTAGGPSNRSSDSSGFSKSLAVVGGTAVALIAVGLGGIYLFWGGLFDSQAHIRFETTPSNVQIHVNGEMVHDGETPYTHDAPPGPTDIAIKKEGYEPDERSRKLEAGTTYRLAANLEKAETGVGEIEVATEPSGASVTVDDGSSKGEAPVTFEEIEEGEHTVEIQKDGFETVEKTVDVQQGKTAELDVELATAEVALTVESDPSGADVRVVDEESGDEVADGETPETFEKLDGGKTYRVEVEEGGYRDWEEEFEPGSDEKTTLEAELERDDEPTGTGSEPVARAGTTDPGAREPGPEETDESGTGGGAGSSSGTSGGVGANSTGGGANPESGGSEGEEEPADETASEESGSETGAGGGSSGGSDETESSGEPGMLKIASTPTAKVHIDGKDTGEYTPLLNYEVSPGKHEVLLTNEKFGLRKTYYVDLEPGETKQIINKSED